jgi:stage V sporulation protein G
VDIAFVKPKDGLIAFASVVLDDEIYLGSIGIHKKLSGDGYRLTYPTRKVGDCQFNVFHPIRKMTGLVIEQAIFAKLNDVVNRRADETHII